MALSYIYKLTCLCNGKSYIGFAVDPQKRFEEHKRDGNRTKPLYLIHKAIKKYGWDNFVPEVIYCSTDSDHCLQVMEPLFIDQHDSYFKNGHGYNMTLGGDGVVGLVFSEETKSKMSAAKKGKPSNRKDYTVSEETRQKLRDARAKQVFSPESIAKRSASNKGKRTGQKHTPETIEIIRQKAKQQYRQNGRYVNAA